VLNHLKKTVWKADKKCRKEVKSDGKASMWGYGVINMNFSKYIIGPIASRRNLYRQQKFITSKYFKKLKQRIKNIPYDNFGFTQKYNLSKNNTTLSLKECLSLIIWRIKDIGYNPDLFKKIDKEIVNSQQNLNRFKNSGIIERYGKKYSWIAYFELHGQLLLNKILKNDFNNYRTSSVDIDPSFPTNPKFYQLLTESFLPSTKKEIQQWVNKDTKYLTKYIKNNFNNGKKKWILLNAHIGQENKDLKVKINIYMDSYLVEKKDSNKLIDLLKNDSHTSASAEEVNYHYLFAGEIPNSCNISNNQSKINDIDIMPTTSYYTWESYHSQQNQVSAFPFLCKELAFNSKVNSYFNLNDLSLYLFSNKKLTYFIRDKYSHFLFIDRSYIEQYLKDNNSELIHREHGYRFGNFPSSEKNLIKLKPSSKGFISIKKFKPI